MGGSESLEILGGWSLSRREAALEVPSSPCGESAPVTKSSGYMEAPSLLILSAKGLLGSEGPWAWN